MDKVFKYDNILLEPLACHAAPANPWTGADIGGTSDQFYYLSQSCSVYAQLTARIVSQDMSTANALVGVMVRASNAGTALTAMTPLDGLPFQSRATTPDSAGTKDYTARYWVRLMRVGNVFTCFRSTDNTTCFQLGPAVTIADAPAAMFAGLHMASINNNGNSVANFDNISLIEA